MPTVACLGTMARYAARGVLPADRTRLWALLRSHLEESSIRRIHPDVTGQRSLQDSGNDHVLERTIRARGRELRSTWKLTYVPPSLTRWEIVGGDGPFAVGSYLVNRYSDDPAGTLVETEGDLRILGVPFLQGFLLRRVFDHIDAEDRAELLRPQAP
jgi:hypothetical protein